MSSSDSVPKNNPAYTAHIGEDDLSIDWNRIGEAQETTILSFIVDAKTEKGLADAEIEARVENRLIRRANGFYE